MNEPQREKRGPSYRVHWCVALLVVATVIGGITMKRHGAKSAASSDPAAQASKPEADWFLMVRCPEMPMETEASDAGRSQLKGWIEALRHAGFVPLAFSEVRNRLVQGERLPRNTAVLMFDPAYRHTVEQILPMLQTLQVPALWVTRSPGTVRADRRFVTAHARRSFAAQPLWDFAVEEDDNRIVLEKASALAGMPRSFEWQAGLGVTGVNRGTNLSSLNRLHANARWSSQQFVDRLLADVPLDRTSTLSVREIESRIWGVVLPGGEKGGFKLQAPGDRRYCSATWEGTRGVNDLDLDLDLNSWFGEAWVSVRSSRESGDKVRVGLAEGKLRVLQELDGAVVDDRAEPWPIQPGEGFRLRLLLRGDTMRITASAVGAVTDVPLSVLGTSQSVVELSFYHRIHGAAAGDVAQFAAVPLNAQGDLPLLEGFVHAESGSGVPAAN